MAGYGWEAHFVEGDDPPVVHQALARTLETVLAKIEAIQSTARAVPAGKNDRAAALADDRPSERPRAGPVPRSSTASRWRARGARTRCRSITWKSRATWKSLKTWMKSYRPEELFDETGAPRESLAVSAAAPASGG